MDLLLLTTRLGSGNAPALGAIARRLAGRWRLVPGVSCLTRTRGATATLPRVARLRLSAHRDMALAAADGARDQSAGREEEHQKLLNGEVHDGCRGLTLERHACLVRFHFDKIPFSGGWIEPSRSVFRQGPSP